MGGSETQQKKNVFFIIKKKEEGKKNILTYLCFFVLGKKRGKLLCFSGSFFFKYFIKKTYSKKGNKNR